MTTTEPINAPDPSVYLAVAQRLILSLPPGEEFINANILAAMRAKGWAPLAEPRQLGPVLLRLKRGGFVEKVDVRCSPARSHGGMTTVWRRTRSAA
jgi:hypothetical protein